MPNTREKLIELVTAALCNQSAEEVADHLIANGVTVQEWISVKDRLPDIDCTVLVKDRVTGEVTTAHLNEFNSFVFEDGRGHGASYWMPLPQPPKEV